MALMPGSVEPMWFGCNGGSRTLQQHNISLEIAPWLGRFDERMTIGDGRCRDDAEMTVETRSTTREEYLAGVRKVIDSCRARDGKTVYSRVMCDGFDADNAPRWGEIADELFGKFPQTFRYILYTPATQGWMGATPETLADYSNDTCTLHTVALAGTRPKQPQGVCWDEKNLRENSFVSDYITRHLEALGLEPHTGELHNVGYGNIEHLCAAISCRASAPQLGRIIDSLNPTPALCGYPLNEAIADIERHERHRRGLYGGFIAIKDGHGYHAFVNLRCVHFSDTHYCVYGGGGITASSDPADEYAETEAKTAFLRQLLGRRTVLI